MTGKHMHANQFAETQRAETGCGCGERLRQAREAAGLRREDVAERLKMPVRVVKSLEEEDWSRLGAPVFVRGQLRSYSRLLGLGTSTTLEAARVGPVEPPALVTRNYIPRHQYLFEQLARRAAYVAITVAILGSVWMGTRSQGGAPAIIESLEAPAVRGFGDAAAQPGAGRTTMAASMAPSLRSPAPAAAAGAVAAQQAQGLSLHFEGDSWFQALAPDGTVLEQGLVPAGALRSFAPGELGRVVLGNAGAVRAERAGEALDLSPFRRANVARFTVSSDGSLTRAAD
jgi:cytoskeleton protein RodZ